MDVSSAFFARSAQSAQNVAAERGVANATGVRCFNLPQATPKSVFAMPRAGKVREVICASAPHHGHGQRDTPSGVGMISGAGLFLTAASYSSPLWRLQATPHQAVLVQLCSSASRPQTLHDEFQTHWQVSYSSTSQAYRRVGKV